MRQLVIKRLKDGSTRLLIHWFRITPDGPIETPSGVVQSSHGPMTIAGVKGQIACHPDQNTLGPIENGMDTLMCLRSDSTAAVTCPDCMATAEFKKAEEELRELHAARG